MAKFGFFIPLALIAVIFVGDVKPLINANDAKKGELPYMASIAFRGSTAYCGAAIINNWYIITSAHMLVKHERAEFDVYLGAWKYYDEDAVKGVIADIKIHPGYELTERHHDVALVRMVDEIKFSEFVQPIALPKAAFPNVVGNTVLVSGFGLDAVNYFLMILYIFSFSNKLEHFQIPYHFMETRHRSNILRYYSPKTISIEQCIEKYEDAQFIVKFLNEDMICAENPTEKALSYGDEGNPLVKDGELVGITSEGCYSDWKSPGVYTKVFSHIDWIKEEMNK